MTSPRMNWERIGRYLAGEASREEAVEVRRWLDEHRSDAELVAALERLTRAVPESRPVDVEAALRRVKARPTPPRVRVTLPARGQIRRWVTQTEFLAAAAAIILVAGVFLFDEVRGLVRGDRPATYSTTVGQRDSVRLADGTLILLGPATRVAVRGRDVDLTGEAFFRVVHNDERPFIVRAGGSVIRDIGTEFTVHSDGAAAIRVAVQEGSVALRRGTDSVMLQQGDVGRIAEGRVEALPGGATAEDFAWMHGELIFRDTPLSTVIADLRRWYGVEVRVADTALLQRRFTGMFTTEPRERVLDVIAMTLPARVERRGDTAYFRPASSSR